MNEIFLMLIIICPLVFLAGLIDAVAGGGGLISLPAYMIAGLPPHLATGTNKCSSTFGTLCSTLRFMKNKKICYYSAVSSAVTALIGSYLGARLNMIVDEKYLRYMLIVALPIIALFLIFKKDFGDQEQIIRHGAVKVTILSILSGLLIGAYDGFFGPGTGTFLILAYTGLIGFDLVTASGNAKIVNLASNIAAFITFALGSKIVWAIGLPAAVFGIAGNWIGSGLALKGGKKIIKPMFFITLGLLMCKIIYDLL